MLLCVNPYENPSSIMSNTLKVLADKVMEEMHNSRRTRTLVFRYTPPFPPPSLHSLYPFFLLPSLPLPPKLTWLSFISCHLLYVLFPSFPFFLLLSSLSSRGCSGSGKTFTVDRLIIKMFSSSAKSDWLQDLRKVSHTSTSIV